MNSLLHISFVLSLGLVLSSCNAKKECEHRQLGIYYYVSDSSRADTVILERYIKNTNYENRVDSIEKVISTTTPGGPPQFPLSTTYLTYDFILKVRPVGKEWRISASSESRRDRNPPNMGGDDPCSNTLSYQVNGQEKIVEGKWEAGGADEEPIRLTY